VILLAAGIALVVWLLIGIYFTYSISRPLLRITPATAAIRAVIASPRVRNLRLAIEGKHHQSAGGVVKRPFQALGYFDEQRIIVEFNA